MNQKHRLRTCAAAAMFATLMAGAAQAQTTPAPAAAPAPAPAAPATDANAKTAIEKGVAGLK